jgi:zinc transporter
MKTMLDWKHIDFSEQDGTRWIRQESGVDRFVADALLEEDTRPRVVQMEGGVLVILRGINLNPNSKIEDMVSIRLWLDAGRVISATRRQLRSISDIRKSIHSGQGPQTTGEFLTLLIHRLTDFIAETTEQIEDTLETAEENVNNSKTFARNSPFSVLRRQTARIRRYMAPQREALDRLSRIGDSVLSAEDQANLREEVNRLQIVIEDLDLIRERAMVAQEEFLGIVAHEQNARMLVLSIVAAIFLPLSFLTGLMGMNVAGLPGMENEWSFWILVVLMLIVSGAIVFLFHQRRWF